MREFLRIRGCQGPRLPMATPSTSHRPRHFDPRGNRRPCRNPGQKICRRILFQFSEQNSHCQNEVMNGRNATPRRVRISNRDSIILPQMATMGANRAFIWRQPHSSCVTLLLTRKVLPAQKTPFPSHRNLAGQRWVSPGARASRRRSWRPRRRNRRCRRNTPWQRPTR